MKLFRKFKEPKKLGLSLRGGGARTLSYLGLFKLLEEENIPIHAILGSSGGALIGGMYASGMSVNEILRLAKKIKIFKFASIKSTLKMKLFDRNEVEDFLRSEISDLKIENSKIQFGINLTDYKTNQSIIARDGDMAHIIVASSASTFLMDPVEINGRTYLDGDFSSGYQATFLRKFCGCNFIIGANPGFARKETTNFEERISSVLGRLYDTVYEYDKQKDPLDFEIPRMAGEISGFTNFKDADKYFEHGYKAALVYRDELLRLLT